MNSWVMNSSFSSPRCTMSRLVSHCDQLKVVVRSRSLSESNNVHSCCYFTLAQARYQKHSQETQQQWMFMWPMHVFHLGFGMQSPTKLEKIVTRQLLFSSGCVVHLHLQNLLTFNIYKKFSELWNCVWFCSLFWGGSVKWSQLNTDINR